MYQHTKCLTANARTLRQLQTDTENRIWYHLRARRFLGYKFRRQFPVENYILDFYCKEKQIAVELDGGQHLEDVARYDQQRTQTLAQHGITVLRFWNNDVLLDTDNVLEVIRRALTETSP